jgi:predicted peptidase
MRACFLFLLCILYFAVPFIYSQTDFEAKKFVASNKDTLNYRELLPENYSPQKKYPLVLFLHGAGERGSDNKAQLMHGSMMFTNPVNREKYPAIVLFPQCPKDNWWTSERRPAGSSNPLQAVKELLDQYIAKGTVDTDRIYIMGPSMGGYGTFDMVCRFPDFFAAAIPICGGINPERLMVAAGKVKFRIYHGDNDDVVPVENSRKAYLALKNFGADVEYIEFPGCNHNSWTPAFCLPDFFSWLFAQKKE